MMGEASLTKKAKDKAKDQFEGFSQASNVSQKVKQIVDWATWTSTLTCSRKKEGYQCVVVLYLKRWLGVFDPVHYHLQGGEPAWIKKYFVWFDGIRHNHHWLSCHFVNLNVPFIHIALNRVPVVILWIVGLLIENDENLLVSQEFVYLFLVLAVRLTNTSIDVN